MRAASPIAALDVLRFLAALHIVLFHVTPAFPDVPDAWRRLSDLGYLGTGLFLILSGFLLTHVHGERLGTPADRTRFWRRRVARLYPPYLIGLALGAVVGVLDDPARVAELGGRLLLCLVGLQVWVPGEGVAFSVNGPSWSIAVLAFAAAALPALLRRLAPLATPPLAGALALVWLAGLVPPGLYLALRPDGPDTTLTASGVWIDLLKTHPLARLPEFVLGAGAALLARRAEIAAVLRRPAALVAAVGGPLLLIFGLAPDTPLYPLWHNGLGAPLAVLLLMTLAARAGARPAAPPVRTLAGASLVLLLTHGPLIAPWAWFGHRVLQNRLPDPVAIAVFLLGAVALSVLVDRRLTGPLAARLSGGARANRAA